MIGVKGDSRVLKRLCKEENRDWKFKTAMHLRREKLIKKWLGRVNCNFIMCKFYFVSARSYRRLEVGLGPQQEGVCVLPLNAFILHLKLFSN